MKWIKNVLYQALYHTNYNLVLNLLRNLGFREDLEAKPIQLVKIQLPKVLIRQINKTETKTTIKRNKF